MRRQCSAVCGMRLAASSGTFPRSLATGRPSRPPVRVCALPRASVALQPLRSRPALLRPRLFARRSSGVAAGCRTPLPEQSRRAHGARRTLAPLAPAPPRARERLWRRRRTRRCRHQLRDASGFLAARRRCSTGLTRASRRMRERGMQDEHSADCRALPALRHAAYALGAPGFPASWHAALAGSRDRSQSLRRRLCWSSLPI